MIDIAPPGSFVAIDFETANVSRDSACAIGIARVEGDRIVRKVYRLIKPPSRDFGYHNTQVHGLAWRDVANAQTFGELWAEIAKEFEGVAFIAAHNAPFDKSVLVALCALYKLDAPVVPYVCTLQLAKKRWPEGKGHKLSDCAGRIGAKLDHHHAGSDSTVCAELLLWMRAHPIAPPAARAVERTAVSLLSVVDVAADREIYFDDPKAKKKKQADAAPVQSTPKQIAAFACGPIHEMRGQSMLVTRPLDDAARAGRPDGKWSKPTVEYVPDISLTSISVAPGATIVLEHAPGVQPPPAVEAPSGTESTRRYGGDRWAAKRHGSEGIPRTPAIVEEQLGNFDPPARAEFVKPKETVTLSSVKPCRNRLADGSECGEVSFIVRGAGFIRCARCDDMLMLATRQRGYQSGTPSGPTPAPIVTRTTSAELKAQRARPDAAITSQRPLF